jgi:hypothetical protein
VIVGTETVTFDDGPTVALMALMLALRLEAAGIGIRLDAKGRVVLTPEAKVRER